MHAIASQLSPSWAVSSNRALDGDIVVVEVLPRHTWRVMHSEAKEDGVAVPADHMQSLEQALAQLQLAPSQRKGHSHRGRVDQSAAGRMVAAGLGASAPASPAHKSSASTITDRVSEIPDAYLQPVAKVVGIFRRAPDLEFVGFVRPMSDRKCLFVPRDFRVPRIMLNWTDVPAELTADFDAHEYTLALATLHEWEVDSKYATGGFVKLLGASGAVEAETEAILREYRIPTAEFDPAVIACLPQVDEEHPFAIPDEEVS